MQDETENLTAAQLEARENNAKRSTGPRTPEGKGRSSQNARKHGLYCNSSFFRDAAVALGEDPREFERLLKGLIRARRPADALEKVLVEDIALLLWKKARLDRAEAAVQVRNLQEHDLERRKRSIEVGREISDTLESDVREYGLRGTLDAPGKFEQVLAFLGALVKMVEQNDFSSNMQESLRALYGTVSHPARRRTPHLLFQVIEDETGRPGIRACQDLDERQTGGRNLGRGAGIRNLPARARGERAGSADRRHGSFSRSVGGNHPPAECAAPATGA